MTSTRAFPFYAKASLLIVGIFFFISMLYIGQSIIVPLVYAIIFAILLGPMVLYLVNKKVNRALAVTLVLSMAIMIASGILAVVISQASLLNTAWPKLSSKFELLSADLIAWIGSCLHISVQKINMMIADEKADLIKGSTAMIGLTLSTMSGILAGAVLVPVYIFMLLYYQPHLLSFIHQLFDADNDRKVSEILTETKAIVQGYLRGLFIEFIIISVLNTIGLLMLGINYAVIFGVAAAILNVIPLIGGVIGIALFVVIALMAKSPIYVLYVIILYSIIQFIDNHYIIPKIIGSKVKLNALVCVIAVIAIGALWGIPGMFLAIPITAMVKLILDRIDPLKPWGFLLGDTVSPHSDSPSFFSFKRFFSKKPPMDKPSR